MAEEFKLRVRMELNFGVPCCGTKADENPVGKLGVDSVTVSVKPWREFTVTVMLWELPTVAVRLVGAAVREKSGVGIVKCMVVVRVRLPVPFMVRV